VPGVIVSLSQSICSRRLAHDARVQLRWLLATASDTRPLLPEVSRMRRPL
jgi:hypothetical protein